MFQFLLQPFKLADVVGEILKVLSLQSVDSLQLLVRLVQVLLALEQTLSVLPLQLGLFGLHLELLLHLVKEIDRDANLPL